MQHVALDLLEELCLSMCLPPAAATELIRFLHIQKLVGPERGPNMLMPLMLFRLYNSALETDHIQAALENLLGSVKPIGRSHSLLDGRSVMLAMIYVLLSEDVRDFYSATMP